MRNFYSTDRLLKKFDKNLNNPLGVKFDYAILYSFVKGGASNFTMLWYNEKTIRIISDVMSNEELDEIGDLSCFEFKHTLFITEGESRYYKELINQFSVKMEDYDEDDRITIYFNYMEKIMAPVLTKLQEGLRQEIIKFGQKIILFPIKQNIK